MSSLGWSWSAPDQFKRQIDGIIPDLNNSADKLSEIYLKANPNYQGRFTVPILFDIQEQTIVNNESSEIIRMFNSSFNSLLDREHQEIDLYPSHLRQPIDEINEWIYNQVNNGVYKAGFATTQQAYEEALFPLFDALDRLEELLSGKQFLVGDRLTEADVRLFTTIVRFDVVYVQHFKCNIKDIRNGYPNINRWLKRLYWNEPAFQETTNFEHIKYHYFTSHPQINPKGIIPKGPLPEIESL
ncbi:hypothetical protein O181_069063 [Austropuccinia psidii MF-1]|uniref:GST C-terminal domain-containing protein n=1 Tax=Austropuccinia psidii MF-1 TaxID=1389203 RepID=A0A9Q3F1J2_9BASI|nr:hypothetical protein [Austropuccinia psidii MF-1]